MNQQENNQIIPISDTGELVYTQWDQLTQISKQIMNAGITKLGNPVQINLIILKGKRLGLDIFEALENISVINNKTSISGALASALVEKSSLLTDKSHVYEGEGDTRKCSVTVQRKGRSKVTWAFSVKEAKTAGLYPGKAGSGWHSYTDSMLYWRALGFCFRREFSDVLQGMYLTEELVDDLPKEIKIVTDAPPVVDPPKAKEQAPDPDPVDTAKAMASPIIAEPSDIPPKPSDGTKPTETSTEEKFSFQSALMALAAKDEVSEEMLIGIVNELRLFPRGVEHKLENLPLTKIQTLVKNWPVVMRQVVRIRAEQEEKAKEAQAEKAEGAINGIGR